MGIRVRVKSREQRALTLPQTREVSAPLEALAAMYELSRLGEGEHEGSCSRFSNPLLGL